MNILWIAECSKKALQETRRILDQFGERKGERTWQTQITMDGLTTVRKLLRKTARRNTAVACHWIKSHGETELLWIVGNLRRFNDSGTVPTHTTSTDIIRADDENTWHSAEAMALVVSIAGLFHDAGKANAAFQAKLRGDKKSKGYEPVRHEWVSLRIFQALVADLDDEGWLTRLQQINASDEALLLANLKMDQPLKDGAAIQLTNPFLRRIDAEMHPLPPFALLVGWLIVTHHRLPDLLRSKTDDSNAYRLDSSAATQLTALMFRKNGFVLSLNSLNHLSQDWRTADFEKVWKLSGVTLLNSKTWCQRAHFLAQQALRQQIRMPQQPVHDAFIAHISRMALMLADHIYSAMPPRLKWQDAKYKPVANTNRITGKARQKLDEHNIGVSFYAARVIKALPGLRRELPSLAKHSDFTRPAQDALFRWQNKAADLAEGLAVVSARQGFFGVNLASTGCGKTIANAKIMYALSDKRQGCRFSIALGLRTLTLQTGDALAKRLHLDEDTLAVMVGSDAVRQLHALYQQESHDSSAQENQSTDKRHIADSAAAIMAAEQTPNARSGSESAESWLEDHHYVRYEGTLDDNTIGKWLQSSPNTLKMLSAPVLVSTIDHLMPATEAGRGGHQIAPMLRLMTADLVLDEPDDFDISDLPALCRLVNWAGMSGARVLLSSATLPPALIQALYEAYVAGRNLYRRHCLPTDVREDICCFWADEFDVRHENTASAQTYASVHQEFVSRRAKRLLAQPETPRRAEILAISPAATANTKQAAAETLADLIRQQIHKLHAQHHQLHSSGKTVSFGLIRFANIDPLVAITQRVLQVAPPADTSIHFCVYHSRFPVAVRSAIEHELDTTLARHQSDAIWARPAVRDALQNSSVKHHIFIVFGSPVTEVGRDHDYDWAIVEPSSLRSVIQLAGRVQRHRRTAVSEANIGLLELNFKALWQMNPAKPAFIRPGFENQNFNLPSKSLFDVMDKADYAVPSSVPRLTAPADLPEKSALLQWRPGSLRMLEHARLRDALFGGRSVWYAELWWQQYAAWGAILQSKTPFRRSAQEITCTYRIEEADTPPQFQYFSLTGHWISIDREKFCHETFQPAERCVPWMNYDTQTIYEALSEKLDLSMRQVSEKFGQVGIRKDMHESNQRLKYVKYFGVFFDL